MYRFYMGAIFCPQLYGEQTKGVVEQGTGENIWIQGTKSQEGGHSYIPTSFVNYI
jgi:hypothetical protein